MSQNGFIFPNFRGENQTYFSCHHLGITSNHVANASLLEKPLPLTPFPRATSGLHSAATGHRAVEVAAAQRSPAGNRRGAKCRKQPPPKALKSSEGNMSYFFFISFFLFPSKHGSLFHCELDV